jgi:uncharacterized protein YdaU (DUF1376 family)
VKKPPAFPVYTKDFDTDERVLMMDLAEEGAYGRLLRHQWREGSIPADHASLGKILRVPEARVRKLWPALEPCFEAHPEKPGRLINGKLERVRAQQEAFLKSRSSAGKKGAESRWLSHGSGTTEPLAPQAIEQLKPSVAVPASVSVAVPVPEQSAPLSVNGKADHAADMLAHHRAEYIREVWTAFCVKAGHPETKVMSANDRYVLGQWMDAGVQLRHVLSAIEDTKGCGYTLAYYKGPVDEAVTRSRRNLQQVTA